MEKSCSIGCMMNVKNKPLEGFRCHMDFNRARGLMRKRGLDALVASTAQNFYYASGYRVRRAAQLPAVAVVPAHPGLGPVVIASLSHESLVRQHSCIKDIRSYPTWISLVEANDLIKGKAIKPQELPKQFTPDRVFTMLSDVLKEKGLHTGIVGIEDNLLTKPNVFSLLSGRNPKAKFVEAESVFWELRKVKTNDEIKALRVAADLGVKGIQAVIEGGVLGVTIGELHLRYKRGVLEASNSANAMDIEAIRANISSGDHFGTLECPGYRVTKGDIIWIDCGLTAFGYNSDMGRTFSAGKPGGLQKKLHTALKAGYEEAISRVKPGVKMKEIYKALRDTVNKSGFEWFTRGHMGHMVGIGPGSIEQPPFVSPEEETELEPNMVICVECGTYVVGRFGGFQIEDMLLITREGHEQLTKLPWDMVEL